MVVVRKLLSEWIVLATYIAIAYYLIYLYVEPMMFGTAVVNSTVTLLTLGGMIIPLSYAEIFLAESMTNSKKRKIRKARNESIVLFIIAGGIYVGFLITFWYSAVLEGYELLEAMILWQVPVYFAIYSIGGISLGIYLSQNTLLARVGGGLNRA